MLCLRSTLLMMMMALMPQAGPGFDPVKDVPVSVSNGVLSVTMPPGAHLKARPFRITLVSGGTLWLGALPAPDGQDEAGDPIWRGVVKVGLKGTDLEHPARLVITYQPCTEGPEGVCFLPVKRTLAVLATEIPAAAP
jgi:hypothetical protein